MAISLVQTCGDNQTKTAATTLAVNFAGATKPAVGDLVIVHCARDNVASDPLTGDSCTDSDGNTYTRVAHGATLGTAAAGAVVVQFYSVLTVAWSAGTNTITWTSPSVAARSMYVQHFTASAGTIAAVGTPGTATGTTAATHASPVTGDLVVGTQASENGAIGTGDSDTTNGSWTTIVGQGSTGGTAATNMWVQTQHKIVTGAGTQSWVATTAAGDEAHVLTCFHETTPPTSSINVTNLTAGIGTSDPQATASVSPTTGAVLILSVTASASTAGGVEDALAVSGLSGTWVQRSTAAWGSRRRNWLFTCSDWSGSGTISLNPTVTDFQEIGWVLDEATGVNTTTPFASIVADGAGAATSTSRTITTTGVPGPLDVTYSSISLETNTNATPEAGWTALGQTTTGSLGVRRIETAWDIDADTSSAWTWGGSDIGNHGFTGILKGAPTGDLYVTYYGMANWFATTTTKSVTGINWDAGDIIVVIGGLESADVGGGLADPTNANLTFTDRASVTTGSNTESALWIWSAQAATAQTNQTIQAVAGTAFTGGLHVWVVTGGPTGVTGATADQTETALSLTTAANDFVAYAFFDWNATNPPGKSPATGSGTATERVDTSDGSTVGVWAADWNGTAAGTFNFGPNNYTSLKVAQGAIVVQAPVVAGGGETGSISTVLGGITATVNGIPGVLGAISTTLGAITATANGIPGVRGAISTTLGAIVATANGAPVEFGTISTQLGAITATASGDKGSQGAISTVLGGITATSSGVPGVRGAIATNLGILTATAFGGIATPTAATFRLRDSTTPARVKDGQHLRAQADGESVGYIGTVLSFTATVAGVRGNAGAIATILGGISASASGNTDPSSAVSFRLRNPTHPARVRHGQQLRAPTIGFASGAIDTSLGGVVGTASGIRSTFGAVSTFFDGIVEAIPAVRGVLGTIDTDLDAVVATASGIPGVRGAISTSLGAVTATASGIPGVRGSISTSLGAVTGAATGVVSTTGAISTSFTLTAVVTAFPGVLGAISTTLGAVSATASGSNGGGGPVEDAADTFTRADADAIGGNWTSVAGTGAIRNNEYYNGDDTGGGAGTLQRHRHNTPASSIDMYVEATLTGFATGGYSDARLMVRWTGTNSFYEVRMDSNGDAILNRVTAGGEESSHHTFETGMTYSFPETWRLEVSGTTTVHLELFRDGVSVGTFDDTDGTRIQSGSHAGLGSFTAGGAGAVTLDNYSHGSLASGADIEGSISTVLGGISATVSGVRGRRGTISTSLGAVVATAVAAPFGIIATQLGAITATVAGRRGVRGAISTSLGAIIATATGNNVDGQTGSIDTVLGIPNRSYVLPGTVGHITPQGSMSTQSDPSGVITIGPGTYNQVYFQDGIYLSGAGDYVFTDCIIEGTEDSWLIMAYDANLGESSTILVEDTTLRWKAGDTLNGEGQGAIVNLGVSLTITVRRCDISGKADGLQLAGTCVVEDCWIHDLVWAGVFPDNTHNDGVQMFGGTIHTVGCYFDVGAQAPFSNSCMFFQGAEIEDVLTEHNYFNGGGYSYYVQNGDHTVRYNTFGPEHLFGEFFLEGSGYSIVEWHNNRDADGNLIGTTVGAAPGINATASGLALPNKWEYVTNQFNDPDNDNFTTGLGAVTYTGGKARFDMSIQRDLFDYTDRDLTASSVHLKVQPNPNYGYVEYQLTRVNGTVIIGSIFKRADQSTLGIFYNGSVVATPTYDPSTMKYWRYREAGGSLFFETSPDTVTWTTRYEATGAGSTFDLTSVEIIVGSGNAVGGTAPTADTEYAYISNLNLTGIDGAISTSLGAITATATGIRRTAGAISTVLTGIVATVQAPAHIEGAIATVLGAVAATATGVRGRRGAISTSLGAITATASDGSLVIPVTPWIVGTEVGVPTGTSLTTRTSLGSPTSTGTYELIDPTGREAPVTVDVDIFEAIEFTTNRLVVQRTTGNVRLFRNCRFAILNEASMVEADEEGNSGTTSYMTPRTIFERCTFDGNSTSGKALSGGNVWVVDCHIAECEDGAQGPFCSVFIHSNVIGGTDGLADPHADGIQLLGIGKAVFWNCHVSAGEVSGAASQALRIGAEFGGNDDVYIAWCGLDGAAGGWTLQARGDNNPTEDNTNIIVHDNVILPGGFGSVDFVESQVALWERNYSDTYGGTLIPNPAPGPEGSISTVLGAVIATATGVPGVRGAISTVLAFGGTASGTRSVRGAVATILGITATASGTSGAFADNFNRADSGSLGSNWTTISGVMGVISNEAYFGTLITGSTGVLQRHRHNSSLDTSNAYAQIRIFSLSTGGYSDARIMSRWAINGSFQRFYELRLNNSGGWFVNRVFDGSETDILSGTVTPSFPETWRLEVSGTSPVHIRVLRNGIEVDSFNDSSGSRVQSGLQAGLGGFTAGGTPPDVTMDDFVFGSLASGDQSGIIETELDSIEAEATGVRGCRGTAATVLSGIQATASGNNITGPIGSITTVLGNVQATALSYIGHHATISTNLGGTFACTGLRGRRGSISTVLATIVATARDGQPSPVTRRYILSLSPTSSIVASLDETLDVELRLL